MTRQWADGPHTLISIKTFSRQPGAHAAEYVATEMACAHNGMIRGLNSIYNQAAHLPAGDLEATRDFLTYCQCWCESMHHHHDAEEKIFFPEVDRISGGVGLMESNYEQHKAFHAGFERFHEYAKTCDPGAYSGSTVRSLIDGFAGPLIQHLRDEIETLRRLDKYPCDEVRTAYKRLEKALMDTDNYRIAPLVFGTADRNFEGGGYNFPAVPFFVPWVIHYVYGRRYRGAWRFNPCTMWRDPQRLAFVGDDLSAS